MALAGTDINSRKPYEGKLHVRFDEGLKEKGCLQYCAFILLYNIGFEK
jgi:hypothetical protein